MRIRLRSNAPLILWLPSLLIALAMVIPLAYIVIRGTVGSDEAWNLIFRVRTAIILWNSLVLVVTVTVMSISLGLPIAWLTVRSDIPLKRLWLVAATLPLVIPSYVGALIVVSTLGPTGILRDVLYVILNIDRLPSIYGIWGATLALALINYPLVILSVRGTLSGLDPSLEESALSLGLSRITVTGKLILPQLKPAIASASLLVALYTLSDFGAVSLLRYETFTWAIYQQYQTSFDRNVALCLSTVLVMLAIIILVTEGLTRSRGKYYRTGPGTARYHRAVALGKWKLPAIAFCTAVVVIGLVGPILTLCYWLTQGIFNGIDLPNLLNELVNSVAISLCAALVTSICSIPVALLTVRYPSIFSYILERLAFTGYALPGIVVALSLVFLGINLARPLYQTFWILIFAYTVLFLPLALSTNRSSLLQISPILEETALGLGRTRVQALFTTTLPQIRTGILMGIALVFLVTIKELPATMLLGPLGFKTLATSIWSASSEALYASAAAPALLLVVVSSIPMSLLLWHGTRFRI